MSSVVSTFVHIVLLHACRHKNMYMVVWMLLFNFILLPSSFAGDFQICEEEGRFGIFWGEHFVPLTNFTFTFVCKVVAPHALKDLTGFMVDVAHRAGTACTTGWGGTAITIWVVSMVSYHKFVCWMENIDHIIIFIWTVSFSGSIAISCWHLCQ